MSSKELLVILIISFFGMHSIPVLAGDGWVRLTMSNIPGGSWRDVSDSGFLQSYLDVDGDGRMDLAAIVVSRDGRRSAVRVCFGDSMKSPQCRVIAEGENVAEVMGLERRPVGCFPYREDEFGNEARDEKICSVGEVIEYFRFGSASSFFVYEKKTGKFSRYWDSD